MVNKFDTSDYIHYLPKKIQGKKNKVKRSLIAMPSLQ